MHFKCSSHHTVWPAPSGLHVFNNSMAFHVTNKINITKITQPTISTPCLINSVHSVSAVHVYTPVSLNNYIM